MTGRNARVAKSQQRKRGIPDRRHACLKAPAVAVLQCESIQAAQATRDDGMVDRHALEVKRDQRIHPGRLNATPAAVGLLTFGHPCEHAAYRPVAQWLPWKSLVELLEVIEPPEDPGARDTPQLCLGSRHDELAQ